MSHENYALVGRFEIAGAVEILLPHLEIGQDAVWLSRTCRTLRATLIGVPAKRVDILVEQGARSPLCVIEVGRKAGRFDGAIRPRITLRRYDRGMGPLVSAILAIDATADAISLSLAPADPAIRVAGWSGTFPRLRSDLEDYNLARIAMWHWRRYYSHISEEVARQAADTFREAHATRAAAEGWTLARANQEASRELYRLSREEGWRKLTLRERQKLGHPDAAQWQREEVWVAWLASLNPAARAMGVGEQTMRWAHEDYMDVDRSAREVAR